MAYNDPQLLHLDTMLSQISVGFQNEDFVTDVLFPNIPVQKQSDKYYVFNKYGWDAVDDIRAPGTEANEVPQMTLSRESYFAEEHALQDVVTDEDVQNADNPLDPSIESTERVTGSIMMGREVAMVDMVTTTSNFESENSRTFVASTEQWNDYDHSTPIADIKAGRSLLHSILFKTANILLIGYDAGVTLEDHPAFIERIKYSQMGVTTDQIIAEVMGIGRIVRASAGKTTNNPGQPEELSYTWGNDALLAYVPPAPGRKVPAFAYEFTWAYPNGGVMPTERWREEKRASDIVRVRRRYDLKFIALGPNEKAVGGYLMKDVIAQGS